MSRCQAITSRSALFLIQGQNENDAPVLIEAPPTVFLNTADFADMRGVQSGSTAFVGPGDDVLYGGSGINIFVGGNGDYEVTSGPADDIIYGDHSDVPVYNIVDDQSPVNGAFPFNIPGPNLDTRGPNFTQAILFNLLPVYEFAVPANNSPALMDANGNTPSGNDTLAGGPGNDSIEGGPGDDFISDFQGFNTLNGGDGDDIIAFGTCYQNFSGASNLTNGGDGVDTISISALPIDPSYTILIDFRREEVGILIPDNQIEVIGKFLNVENVIISPNSDQIGPGVGNNYINGAGFNDTIFGSQGDDTLGSGGSDGSPDILTGGPDADVFVPSNSGGGDTITNFVQGVDRIGLFGLSFVDITFLEDKIFIMIR